jgi:diguanylate cyclase (GGDEF)-like protein/PAS domain S-box-containing protein
LDLTEELVGQDFMSFIYPDDQADTLAKLQLLVSQDEPVKFVNRFHGEDKAYRYMEWHGLSHNAQLYLAARDITQSRIERAYFEALFLNTTDAMLYFDRERRIFNLNKQFTELFGYTLQELQGVCPDSFFSPEEQEHPPLCQRILQGETVAMETVCISKSGKLIPVFVKGGPVYIDGELKGGFAVYTDISERKAYEEHLKHLSLHDQLTGLYNRNFFETQIKVIEKSKRYPISIIVFDVDGLKLVNDTLGHARGDKLLQMVADIISNSLRANDFLARIGGDEFVAILPETDEETVFKIADRVRANIRKANEASKEFPISVSVGAATAFNHNTTLREVIRKADERMYHEKLVEKRGTKAEMLAFLLKALGEINAARKDQS